MSLAQFRGSRWTLDDSAAESARFGLEITRAVVPRDTPVDALPALAASIEQSSADIVILRTPAERSDAAALTPRGYRALPAGTLVYWEGRLDRVRDVEPRAGLTTRPVGAADREQVADLIARIFDGYRNHYSADPLLDDALAATGYAEWAERTVLGAQSGSVILDDGGSPRGVATASSGGEWEIELAGILPEHQRGGLYAHLLRGIHESARAAGAERVVISTQSHNIGVQRAWARLGYEPIDAIETVHLVRDGLLPV